MHERTFFFIVLIFSSVTLFSQPRGYLVKDSVVVFYADDFDADGILPSLTVKEEFDSIGTVPGNWQITPNFSTANGQGQAAISYEEGADLYGCGEVTGTLRNNEKEIVLWNTDNYTYQKDGGKRLYQSHPWIMGVRDDGTAFGILVDNTWKQTFYLANPIRIESQGPPFRIFVIEKSSPLEVVKTLTELTGNMDLPPLWALGYQQCRYSYYPASDVMGIADNMRAYHLPCDVIWMDIDYMDGYRVFTFDPNGFSDPTQLNDYLHSKDFKAVYMIDPGIKKDNNYFVYAQGSAGDHWVLDSYGNTYNGTVWPGECTFPDFTRQETRDWWAGLYADFMAYGIDGIWNDMNEPSVFDGSDGTMPDDNIHRGTQGGLPQGSHLRYHNAYGMLMIKATRQGVMNANPGKRPFVLSRANYIGGNRYAATWTGDNEASWDHLKLSVPMSLNLSLSGQFFNGPDIGGFSGSPSADMFAHWMAVGAFYPFCRNHSEKGTNNQEPWSFNTDVLNASRIALQRRYRLMPYLYTLFYQASATGAPVMRPMFFADPADTSLRGEQEAFLLGSDLMVIPQWAQDPALPQGEWHTVNVLKAYDQDDFTYQPVLKQKEGSVIPLAQPMQSTEGYATDSVTLLIAPDDNLHAEGTLYHDSLDGYTYQQDMYATTHFVASHYMGDSIKITCRQAAGAMDVSQRAYQAGLVMNDTIQYYEWIQDTVFYIDLSPEIYVTADAGDDQTITDQDANGTATVTLDASESSGDSTLYFAWKENGDTIATGINPDVMLTIGSHNITLIVTDIKGYADSDRVNITVRQPAPCSAPVIVTTDTPPLIDENIDAVWETTPDTTINNVVIGSMPPYYAARWRALCDDDKLYVLVEVNDTNKHNDSGTNWWDDDGVKLYIDGDNSDSTTYDGMNDFELAFRWDDSSVITGPNSVQDTGGIDFTLFANDTGYVLEVEIPWNTIGISPVSGDIIGFDVVVNVDEDGGNRDAEIVSLASSAQLYNDPSLFGTVTIASCPYPANQYPTAGAGQDQTRIDDDNNGSEYVTLNGEGSHDPDGNIIKYAWYEDSVLLDTGKNVTVLLDTGYHHITLAVTDNNGATATDDILVTIHTMPTQITEKDNTPLSIYPSPVSEFLYISAGCHIEKIQVYDACGNMIKEKENISRLDMSKLNNGLYIIKVITSGSYYLKKILKY